METDTQERYHSIVPPSYAMNTTKLSRTLKRREFSLGEMIEVKVGTQAKPASVYFTLNEEGREAGELNTLDPYDGLIYEAIATLAAVGNKVITVNMVYRLMVGDTGDRKHLLRVSNASKETIYNRIKRMNRVTLDADFTQQNELNDVSPDKPENTHKGVRKIYIRNLKDVPLLEFKEGEFDIDGNITQGFLFESLPVLYRYSETQGQLRNIDKPLLNLTYGTIGLNNNPRNNVLNLFCIERISDIKAGKLTPTITAESLYEEYARAIGKKADNLSQKQKKDIKAVTKDSILPLLVEKGFIENFEVTRATKAQDTKFKLKL